MSAEINVGEWAGNRLIPFWRCTRYRTLSPQTECSRASGQCVSACSYAGLKQTATMENTVNTGRRVDNPSFYYTICTMEYTLKSPLEPNSFSFTVSASQTVTCSPPKIKYLVHYIENRVPFGKHTTFKLRHVTLLLSSVGGAYYHRDTMK